MTNLIPEARADKNGNMVTRWVRGMFGGGGARSSSFPKPALATQESNLDREIREFTVKFAVRLPDKAYMVMPRGERRKSVRQADVMGDAIASKDINKLTLISEFGDAYEPTVISKVLDRLRMLSGDEVQPGAVTEARLSAYSSFLDAIPEEADESGINMWGYSTSLRERFTDRLGDHLLFNLGDGPALEVAVKRGITDFEEAMTMVEALRNTEVPTAIDDGFL